MTLALLLLAAGAAKIPPPLNPQRAGLAAQTLTQICMGHSGQRALTDSEVSTLHSLDVVRRPAAPDWVAAYLPGGATATFVLEYPTPDDESEAFAVSFGDRRCTVVVRGVAPAGPETNVRGLMRYWRARTIRAPGRSEPGIAVSRFGMRNVEWRLETRDLPNTPERGVLILTSAPAR